MDSEKISADRLCEAAEAVMVALIEHQETTGQPLRPPSVMGTDAQPAGLCEFTREEVQEATDFLFRLGFVERG